MKNEFQDARDGLQEGLQSARRLLIAAPEPETTYSVGPDQYGWIARGHFNGFTGFIYAAAVLFLLGAVIGLALYARQ